MHFYRIAAIVLGSLALLFGGFLIVGLLLPSGWEVERATRIEASPDEVFPFVSSAERWGDWTPSPPSGVELFGPGEGPGSGSRWEDPTFGTGEFVIVDSATPQEVAYEVAVEGGAIRIQGRIQLESERGGTQLRWVEVGDFGWNPLLGYLAGRMNELQGSQMEASLDSLKARVESAALTSAPD